MATKNPIEIYLTHNKEKSVVAERFIRTLKSKIYKHMTSTGCMFLSRQVRVSERIHTL